MVKLNQEFLNKVKGPIEDVFQYIGHDLEAMANEMGESLTNEGCLECCIDANRLSSNGHKEADDLIMEAVRDKEIGYIKLMKFLKKNINLY